MISELIKVAMLPHALAGLVPPGGTTVHAIALHWDQFLFSHDGWKGGEKEEDVGGGEKIVIVGRCFKLEYK